MAASAVVQRKKRKKLTRVVHSVDVDTALVHKPLRARGVLPCNRKVEHAAAVAVLDRADAADLFRSIGVGVAIVIASAAILLGGGPQLVEITLLGSGEELGDVLSLGERRGGAGGRRRVATVVVCR